MYRHRRRYRAQFGRIVILCIQERENLNLHGIRTIVVRARGIHAGDLIGGADGDRGSARRIGVLHAAACGQRCDCRDGCDSRQNLAMILQKYLFLNYSRAVFIGTVTKTMGLLC